MIYLWEALLCIRMAQIPEKTIQFVHAPHGSPYMEMALPCLNQTWLEDIVEVNTYYRFYSILVVFLILCLCPSTLFQRPGVGGAHEPL